MSHSNSELPDPRLIRHALEKLRGRDGLTAARLLASRNGDAAALLELGAVRRYAAEHNVDPPQAALELIKKCVSDDLEGSHRIVADAIFGLGAFADTYESQQVDARTISALSSDLLGRRRVTLLSRWDELHQALGLASVDVPSDRILRGTLEPEMLTSLAEHLIRREVHSSDSRNARISAISESLPSGFGSPAGKAIVLGGAVIDIKYRMKTLPEVDMATDARSLSITPGGKGLFQAIAAARLGLETSLIAAVARDSHGDEIMNFLNQEGVNTSLIKRVDLAGTSFTTVLELELGESAAVFSRDTRTRLEPYDVDVVSDQISNCDVVLITFEPPKETIEAALRLVSQRPNRRPITIVTPGQPYHVTLSSQSLSTIDYLVARKQELEQYQPADGGPLEVDDAARVLLTQGVGTLCVTDRAGCSVYSRSHGLMALPAFPSPYRVAAISRDAFCAALAARLLENHGQFSEEVALWATAAMAAATADHPISNPMPDRRRIQDILHGLPFSVHPRGKTDSLDRS